MINIGITDRMNEVCGFKTDKELAELLGLKQSNLSNRKKKGTLNDDIIKKCLELHLEVNLDWLITGQGFKYKEKIKEPDKEYDLQGGWEPHKMDSEDYALLGQAFEILRSKSTYRTALVYNIKAFHRAIKSESIKNIKIERLESDIDELRERIDVLEKEKAFDKGECQP